MNDIGDPKTPVAQGGWVPSATFLAGAAAALGLSALAVLTGRVDLLVLALPLIGVATWSHIGRPHSTPSVQIEPVPRALAEGTSATWAATLTDAEGTEQWHTVVETTSSVVWDGDRHIAGSTPTGADDRIELTFALHRWGPATVGSAEVVAASPWGGYVWGPLHLPGADLRGLPRTDPFAGRTSVPHPVGLVGPNRSSRYGDGTEFADIRAFRPGDKLRTIHWPVTTRTGALHVRTSYAEQDAEVVLVLDASVEAGGRGARDSSLDLGLRACASLSQFFLARGDRVGLDVIGTGEFRHVPVSLGARHQHRVLDALSTVRVGRHTDALPDRVRLRISPGATVFLVSPLVTELGVAVAADLARRGHRIAVIDCLPTDLTTPDDDEWDRRALRIRLLEREVAVDGLAVHGVPVAPWRGPGSLDGVLRVLARRPPTRGRVR